MDVGEGVVEGKRSIFVSVFGHVITNEILKENMAQVKLDGSCRKKSTRYDHLWLSHDLCGFCKLDRFTHKKHFYIRGSGLAY